ncbi:unnamed protein product [Brassicogethes aeneus]|uniref:Uncharacterized protein n=1 Tax=Brassicogethes aeneus TaxID=1431903 RepID=A0A9P0FLE7_BRAAE|nr:unnamed protein product [Brassicogethes aeneus]
MASAHGRNESLCPEAQEKKFKRIFGRSWGCIDIPEGGLGKTNDGNTARRFFDNTSSAANILQVDEELLENAEKFRNFCLGIARRYVELYKWFPMPTSCHAILIYGADIIESIAVLRVPK